MKIPNFSVAVIAAILAAGCATSGGGAQEMYSADSVPAADGKIEAKEGENGNTVVKVSVEHLANPQAVDPSASTYVVWAQDSALTGNVQNLGALRVDKNLKGGLEAITPMKTFDLFITAEPIATAQYPTGEKTLWTTVVQ